MKSASLSGGSTSSSESISDQVFSTAFESPGEHGVHLAFPDDEEGGIGLKCVAEMTLRTGCIRASRTTMDISEPEYLGSSWVDYFT